MSYKIRTKFSWAATQQELATTFEKWGIREWDTNYPRGSRLTGWYQSPEDRTVTLRYKSKEGKEVILSMNSQDRAIDNLRVLWIAVEAIRMNEVRGIGGVLQEAYKQLSDGYEPVVIRGVPNTPWELLEISPNASLEVAEAAYRARARKLHPDTGDFEQQMKELNQAIEFIRKELQ